ncbi:MAG: hypothetical protein HKM07_08500 [Chlamydiae bacterium]|nr:hypothetical protein [Chlamydiota bacterium]
MNKLLATAAVATVSAVIVFRKEISSQINLLSPEQKELGKKVGRVFVATSLLLVGGVALSATLVSRVFIYGLTGSFSTSMTHGTPASIFFLGLGSAGLAIKVLKG